MFLNCGLSRRGIFRLKSATTASCVWMTCCMRAPPASLEQTRCSGVSTLSSTTSLLSGACACTSTRRRTRSDARSDWWPIVVKIIFSFVDNNKYRHTCILFDSSVMGDCRCLSCIDWACVCIFDRRKAHILAWSAFPSRASQVVSLWSNGTQSSSPVSLQRVVVWAVERSLMPHWGSNRAIRLWVSCPWSCIRSLQSMWQIITALCVLSWSHSWVWRARRKWPAPWCTSYRAPARPRSVSPLPV